MYQVALQQLVWGCMCWVTGGTRDSDSENMLPSFTCACKQGATACVSQAWHHGTAAHLTKQKWGAGISSDVTLVYVRPNGAIIALQHHQTQNETCGYAWQQAMC